MSKKVEELEMKMAERAKKFAAESHYPVRFEYEPDTTRINECGDVYSFIMDVNGDELFIGFSYESDEEIINGFKYMDLEA